MKKLTSQNGISRKSKISTVAFAATLAFGCNRDMVDKMLDPPSQNNTPPVFATFNLGNLIGDYLDRTSIDRAKHDSSKANTDTISAYPYAGLDTSENAHPFSDGKGGSLGLTNTFLYKIGGDQFEPFAVQTIVDNVSGGNYRESQSVWISASNYYVNDTDIKSVVGDLKDFYYQVKFDGPGASSVGIPVCSEVVSGASTGDFAACKDSSVRGYDTNKASDSHRIRVGFLGEQWVISEMNPPSNATITSETERVAGGSIKLAKESAYGTLTLDQNGRTLDIRDGFKIILNGVQANDPNKVFAEISLIDSNGQVVKDETVQRNGRVDFLVNGKTIRIRAYNITADSVVTKNWAQLAVYSNEIEIKDDAEFDQSAGLNRGYKATVVWSNLDASNLNKSADTLKSVIIYADDLPLLLGKQPDRLLPGDSLSLVSTPSAFNLTYHGLNTANEGNLSFTLQTSSIEFAEVSLPNGQTVRCKVFAPYLKVTNTLGKFELADSTSQTFIVGLNGSNMTNETIGTGLSNYESAGACDTNMDGVFDNTDKIRLSPGVVFMKFSDAGFVYKFVEYQQGGLEVSYPYLGDGKFMPSSGGAIKIQRATDVIDGLRFGDSGIGSILRSAGYACDLACVADVTSGILLPTFFIATSEKAGIGVSNGFADYPVFGILGTATGTPGDISFLSQRPITDFNGRLLMDQDRILYGPAVNSTAFYDRSAPGNVVGPVNALFGPVYEGYITNRGTKITSISSWEIKLNVGQVRTAMWAFSNSKPPIVVE